MNTSLISRSSNVYLDSVFFSGYCNSLSRTSENKISRMASGRSKTYSLSVALLLTKVYPSNPLFLMLKPFWSNCSNDSKARMAMYPSGR